MCPDRKRSLQLVGIEVVSDRRPSHSNAPRLNRPEDPGRDVLPKFSRVIGKRFLSVMKPLDVQPIACYILYLTIKLCKMFNLFTFIRHLMSKRIAIAHFSRISAVVIDTALTNVVIRCITSPEIPRRAGPIVPVRILNFIVFQSSSPAVILLRVCSIIQN